MRKGWSFQTTVIAVLATPFLGWAWIAIIEWLTLTDGTESNHITAAFRQALDTMPELMLVVLLALTVVNVGALGLIVGHLWHRWGPSRPRKKDW